MLTLFLLLEGYEPDFSSKIEPSAPTIWAANEILVTKRERFCQCTLDDHRTYKWVFHLSWSSSGKMRCHVDWQILPRHPGTMLLFYHHDDLPLVVPER